MTMNLESAPQNAGIPLKKKSEWHYLRKNLSFLGLSAPGLLLLILFKYLPIYGLVLPFKSFRADLGFWKSEWCGFDNFAYLFKGAGVVNATVNTLLYNTASIVLCIVFGVLIALLLFELSARFVKGYQTMLFFPYFVSWVVVAFIAKAMLDMDHGSFNSILKALGREPVMWYNESGRWPAILLVAMMWKALGQNALIYYAALMGVSHEYFEAAKLDGATKRQQIRYISVPMIKNVIIILFILNVGRIMYADFGLFYNVPMNSPILYPTTDVLDTFVYRALINLNDIGMSSAVALYQSVVGFFLVLASNMIAKKFDPDSGLF